MDLHHAASGADCRTDPVADRIRCGSELPARTAARWLRIKTTADAHFSPTDLTSPVVLGELLVEQLWTQQPERGHPLELVVADLHAQAASLQAQLRERDAEVAELRRLLAERRAGA